MPPLNEQPRTPGDRRSHLLRTVYRVMARDGVHRVPLQKIAEEGGILLRTSYPERPPRVEYELTEKGRGLLPVIDEMRRYGHQWLVDC